MFWVALGGIALFFGYLVVEKLVVDRQRKGIPHVVHVNGTRGKSTVCRMIYGGLAADGRAVYCKTTGTVPSVIGQSGVEEALKRRGANSIKEQLGILGLAYRERAEVLVVECMAISPELQWVSQQRMLKADVGVITNARLDHTDVMGESLGEIRAALCSTLPQGGVCFTTDPLLYEEMKRRGEPLETTSRLVDTQGLPDFDFAENVGTALEVCQYLGVERETALKGILSYPEDPYVFKIFQLPAGGLVASGLSINDVGSAGLVIDQLREGAFAGKALTILLSNRQDRAFRSRQFVELILEQQPEGCIVLGGQHRKLADRIREGLPHCKVESYGRAEDVPLEKLGEGEAIFATGNLLGEGQKLADRLGKEGERCRSRLS